MSRSEQLMHDFEQILQKWKQALNEPKSGYSRDAAILRFELSYEVGWKLIQHLARKQGYEVQSPRQAFQQAFSLEWTSNEIVWDDIIEARNKATHVYREEYADQLYDELDRYYHAFNELFRVISDLEN